MKETIKQTKKRKNFKLLAPSILLVGILLSIISIATFNSLRAYPLGEKLEYIGKESSGGWFPMSSAAPSDLYYYATDMDAKEVVAYFPKAKLSGPLQNSSEYVSFDLVTSSEKKISVTLYLDKNTQVKNIPDPFKSTSKRHLFTVADYNYESLKQSL